MKIKINIDCGGKYCGKCQHLATIGDDDYCSIFKCYLLYHAEDGAINRADKCKHAEVKCEN